MQTTRTLLLFALVQASMHGAAWLHGAVLDMRGAAIPGIQIRVLSGNREACVTRSDADGKFTCEMAPGRYRITAYGVNILPYRRSSVTMDPEVHRWVVVRPVFVAPSDTNARDPALQYVEDQLTPVHDVLVRFDSSAQDSDRTIYSGEHLMLSFDTLTVYSRQISCSQPIRLCSAAGDVIVEIGNEQLTGTSAEIDFTTRRLTVTRQPTITKGF